MNMRCHQKIRFASFAIAEAERLRHEETYAADKGELCTYQCPRCGGFHNGHPEMPSRAADRAVAQSSWWGFNHRPTMTLGERVLQQRAVRV